MSIGTMTQVRATPIGTSSGAQRNITLDYLRGLAVLLVLGYHAWPQVFPGGLIGVDLFFVLSGYFVTTILLRPGTRLDNFWVRRGRRLYPALLAVLPIASALSLLLYPNIPAKLATQWLGALTWSSNWLYVFGDASYFARFEPPLWLHLWSLGVEGQFYLVWPLILVLTVRATKRFRPSAVTRVVGAALATLALASALAMMLGTWAGADPSVLYMNTATHAFGVFGGSSVAAFQAARRIAPAGTARDRWAFPSLGLASLALLGFVTLALFLPASDTTTLAWGLPLATALAVAAVAMLSTRESSRNTAALRPLLWLGTRSYAVYLWHWPLLLILRGIMGSVTVATSIAAGVLMLVWTFLLAEVSWRWLERPVLKNGWRGTVAMFTRWLTASPKSSRKLLLCAVTIAIVLMAAAVALVLSPGVSPLEQQLS